MVSIYYLDSLENDDTIQLARGGLLLVALMAGGDYDDGIQNCGPTIARSLAKSGFGNALLSAFETQSKEDFKAFLIGWRCSLCQELANNTRGFLSRRHAELASNITTAFPNIQVLEYYASPITSWSQPLPMREPLSAAQWQPREPTIHLIATFCVERLGWDAAPDLLKTFRRNLWSGVFCRMLCDVCISISGLNMKGPFFLTHYIS